MIPRLAALDKSYARARAQAFLTRLLAMAFARLVIALARRSSRWLP